MKTAVIFFPVFICYLVVISFNIPGNQCEIPDYIVHCAGTSFGGATSGENLDSVKSQEDRYEAYRKRYENCRIVDGNLELIYLKASNTHNLTFLRSIQEVTGYVMIFNVFAKTIPLTSLRIIRGEKLLKIDKDDPPPNEASNTTSNVALYVVANSKGNTSGLRELQLPQLTEISKGNVIFTGNEVLCFERTINWTEILSDGYKNVSDTAPYLDNVTRCGKCNCGAKPGKENRCWGRGNSMCQKFTRSYNCPSRCYGDSSHSQCCHSECAAGCTGPTNRDCLACRTFNDSGACERVCPEDTVYDHAQQKEVPRTPKYKFYRHCVDQCPHGLLIDKEKFSCVVACSGENRLVVNRTCTSCQGQCPSSCQGNDELDPTNNFVHANNIAGYINCSIVQGSLRILQSTFDGDEHYNIPPMDPSRLSALESVEEITDYLRVDARHAELISLKFLKNLKTIHGRKLNTRSMSAIMIVASSLQQLDLNSLRNVVHGNIVVADNKYLCYANTPQYWQALLMESNNAGLNTSLYSALIVKSNGGVEECDEEGLICSEQCTDVGCVGPADDQCWACSNYRFGRECLETCEKIVKDLPRRLYTTNVSRECGMCHDNCLDTCDGPGADGCRKCSFARHGEHCVTSCPIWTYHDVLHGECLNCNDTCANDTEGNPWCTGPGAYPGNNGCRSCDMGDEVDIGLTRCLPRGSKCQPGTYLEDALYTVKIGEHEIPKKGCKKCHTDCTTCLGDGNLHCTHCIGLNCTACDRECVGCDGPTASDCTKCRHLVIYEDYGSRLSNGKFNCSSTCPKWAPYKILNTSSTEVMTYCVDERYATDNKRQLALICGLVIGGLVVISLVVVCILLLRRQLAKMQENRLRLKAKILGPDQYAPYTPTDAKPDMAVLRIIKETELRKGTVIGSGAFGTVYKGMWVPEGENAKIPIAIKVLSEDTKVEESKSMLEETRIMASVVHPCCIRVLGVCLTAKMMLITQLMPLGCLLDFVQKHKNNIGSQALLNWCTQIARGMMYLESKGIVHRDLAARNVLVHNAKNVKITDFGLAKMVDEDGQFYASSGKVPIKWLALECILHRTYTHKSDVWSYGITLWELFTYGSRPYEKTSARDMLDVLQKGERLSQPSICTIDVYMLMLQCWMVEPDCRPTFTHLESEFAKMASDPARYLVIPNDKLLRLPSQPSDPKELLRNISVALDGPEEIVLAEEYVNEITRRQSIQPPIIPDRRSKDDAINNDASTRNNKSFFSKNKRGKEPTALELLCTSRTATTSEGSSGEGGSSELSVRYSPDPCFLKTPTNWAFPDMPCIEENSSVIEEGTMEMATGPRGNEVRLPLDDTEYLQPKSAEPASYLELEDDTEEFSENDPERSKELSTNSDKVADEQSSLLNRTAVENPEYYSDKTVSLLTGHES